MKKFLFLLISVFSFSSVWFAQAPEEYPNWFCSYYDYSVACYEHRDKVSGKVAAFSTKMIATLQEQPAAFALLRLRDMDDQLAEYQQSYAGTQREYLILLLRGSLYPYLLEVEEKVLTLNLTQEYLATQKSVVTDKQSYIDQMKRLLIAQLIEHWFDGFVDKPFIATNLAGALTANTDTNEVYVSTPLSAFDPLDLYLIQHFENLGDDMTGKVSELNIPPSMYREWLGQVYLFKTTEDLQALWYGLVSHRVRTNTDAEYRRTNIATSFDQIGHVTVLNPGDEFSFINDSNFDPGAQQLYQDGFVIFMDEEVEDYGWGLCGWSTAIYQWIVTNKSLSRPALRNHSKWYHHLYDATIDGQAISTPGIDSTIYSNSLDLRIRNTVSHPIVLVLNYEWWHGEAEEIFTVWYTSDKWYVSHVWSRPYHSSINVKGWGTRKVTGQCHTWNINGEERESCYKEVKS